MERNGGDGDDKSKLDWLDRTDSGIESFRSFSRSDRCSTTSSIPDYHSEREEQDKPATHEHDKLATHEHDKLATHEHDKLATHEHDKLATHEHDKLATDEHDKPATHEHDKLATDERLDSSYGSSSIHTESLSDIMGKCSVSERLLEPDQHTVDYTEEEGILLATVTDEGDTIPHLAIIHGLEEFTCQVITLYPKEILDIQNNLYQTPLHLAVYLNQIAVVKALVARGACLELQDQDGNTPLHVACEHGRFECANEMIHQPSPSMLTPVFETQNWRGLTCLHVATLHKHHRIMKLLIKKGVDLNLQEGTSGKTALHMAVELHDVNAVTLLLNRGANIDAAMLNGCTALHLAVGRQDSAITSYLCHAGADKMIRNMEDETALDLADGNDDLLALLPFDDIQIMGRTVALNF